MGISTTELRRAVESQEELDQLHRVEAEGARRTWLTVSAWIARRRRWRRTRNTKKTRPLDAEVRFRAWIERGHEPPEPDTPDHTDTTTEEDRQRRKKWLANASPWVLVCEEFIDTVVTRDEVQRLHAELQRRGASTVDIEEMRALAFRTAGWFNFALLHWDWFQLDERDVREALDTQLAWELVTVDEYERACAYVRNALSRFGPRGTSGSSSTIGART